MKTIITKGIVLSRTDFGEADRILHFITPDQGKVTGIAKGVRKSKSKLAGGIELFSISELSFVVGRGEIYTIISARLVNHFDNIVKDLDRTSAGYEFIRMVNKATEDNSGEEYYKLLQQGMEALDDVMLDPELTAFWFKSHLIKLAGHSPDLQTNTEGKKLSESKEYSFDFDSMHFFEQPDGQGTFNASHIKFLRLSFAAAKPQILHKVKNSKKISGQVTPLIQTTLQSFISV